MILLGNCPLCSGSNLLKKFDCIDHSTSKEKFTIVSCETCEFTFTNPRPKDNSLGEYYESDMYISHTNNNKGLFNWMYHTVRKYAIGTKLNLLKRTSKNKNHLDIGCGTGEFLNACKKHKYDIIFMLRPWEEIYINDTQRYESYKELVKIDNFIYNTYTSLNYKIIEIPKTSIKNRLEFIYIIH